MSLWFRHGHKPGSGAPNHPGYRSLRYNDPLAAKKLAFHHSVIGRNGRHNSELPLSKTDGFTLFSIPLIQLEERRMSTDLRYSLYTQRIEILNFKLWTVR